MGSPRSGYGDRGAVTVELVVMLPIIILLLGAILATGVGLSVVVSATNAAREGARLAAVGVDDCTVFQNTVTGRAVGVDVDSVELSYTDASVGTGGELTVELTYRNGLANRFLPFFRSPATITAVSRVELVGDVTSCS